MCVFFQVTGELSTGGRPMRAFVQTFVLAPESPKKYYVHNDIFRYQDDDLSESEINEPPGEWEGPRNRNAMLSQHLWCHRLLGFLWSCPSLSCLRFKYRNSCLQGDFFFLWVGDQLTSQNIRALPVQQFFFFFFFWYVTRSNHTYQVEKQFM